MTTSINLFSQNYETNISEKIVSKIKKGEWNDILSGLCNIKDNNSILLDYIYFKHFATKDSYNIIVNYITNNINNILDEHNGFILHINMQKLTVIDIEKHMVFIQNISIFLKEKYPNKLIKCFIYNAPFVFSKIFSVISLFIDKETQSKIELVTTR